MATRRKITFLLGGDEGRGVLYKIFDFIIIFFFKMKYLLQQDFILMKPYTTPPSIITLWTWVPQSKVAFGHSAHRLGVGPLAIDQTSAQPGLPLAAAIGPAGRSRVVFFVIEFGPLLDRKALY